MTSPPASRTQPPDKDAVLQLAPGGKIFAWMVPKADLKGLFSIQLMAMPSRKISELSLSEFPFGFGALMSAFFTDFSF